jgi:hypothetical protein
MTVLWVMTIICVIVPAVVFVMLCIGYYLEAKEKREIDK